MSFIKYVLLGLAFLASGCGNDKHDITAIDNPELVVIAFFDALYNERNIKKAASVCNPKLSRIILHYKSPQAVGRHLFNMQFDKVDITPDDSGVKVREQFKDTAVITVFFDGLYRGDKTKDVKRLSLIQVDDKWVINKILKDPF
ncbi:hypothetical protein [Colwellia sp. UCD-KL20]|uniref:hypothetical protein n=1 Tax=Colwellia sp. UCD-KL20 TaxID=1917165 RepID=UPI0009712DBA|nr:hypothetical protein [Colwellia sp. UCD-KL20]